MRLCDVWSCKQMWKAVWRRSVTVRVTVTRDWDASRATYCNMLTRMTTQQQQQQQQQDQQTDPHVDELSCFATAAKWLTRSYSGWNETPSLWLHSTRQNSTWRREHNTVVSTVRAVHGLDRFIVSELRFHGPSVIKYVISENLFPTNLLTSTEKPVRTNAMTIGTRSPAKQGLADRTAKTAVLVAI